VMKKEMMFAFLLSHFGLARGCAVLVLGAFAFYNFCSVILLAM
jgi:hypothetical protein